MSSDLWILKSQRQEDQTNALDLLILNHKVLPVGFPPVFLGSSWMCSKGCASHIWVEPFLERTLWLGEQTSNLGIAGVEECLQLSRGKQDSCVYFFKITLSRMALCNSCKISVPISFQLGNKNECPLQLLLTLYLAVGQKSEMRSKREGHFHQPFPVLSQGLCFHPLFRAGKKNPGQFQHPYPTAFWWYFNVPNFRYHLFFFTPATGLLHMNA